MTRVRMNLGLRKRLAITGPAAMMASSPVAAATQGAVGQTSTARMQLSLTIPEARKASGSPVVGAVDTGLLGPKPAGGDLRDALRAPICLPGGLRTPLRVLAAGSGPGHGFSLGSANGDKVDYAVLVEGSHGGPERLVPNRGSAVVDAAGLAVACSGGGAALRIELAPDAAAKASHAPFQGTVSVVLSPE